MGKKKSTAPKVGKRRKTPKPTPAADAAPKKPSALDAAAQVLAGAAQPMSAPELIAAMAARDLWSSPNGKTPAATVAAAIGREIATKGTSARFRKAGRGRFAAR
jgi:HB1, ASXL, restriction endonuclease HTH domain